MEYFDEYPTEEFEELHPEDVSVLLYRALYLSCLFVIALAALAVLVGCGSGGGDDMVEDNRVCITNVNNNPDVDIQLAEAEELEEVPLEEFDEVPVLEGDELPDDGPFDQVPVIGRQVAICGSATDVEAVVSNPQGREALAEFLANGKVF